MPGRGRTTPAPRAGRPTGDPEPSARDPWELGTVRAAVDARLAAWSKDEAVRRVWEKDPSFWPGTSPSAIANGLGWLRAPGESAARIAELTGFAEEIAAEGFEHVVLLGMGGSSLAPEVITRVAPPEPGRPDLVVLDSTHPAAVRACLARAPVDRSLYIVSSKSGTTLEPNVFFRFFWERASKLGSPERRFVAITDPGTPLERLASEHRLRACFLAPPDVVGRYSALTVFGLLPAAMVGVDLDGLLERARGMAARCAGTALPDQNPGLRLGATLGELARAGRDKLVFLTSPTLAPFPAWCEQLVAESTGKLGRGLIPVVGPANPEDLGSAPDVAYLYVALGGEADPSIERQLAARVANGTPVLRFPWSSALDLGGAFFLWEFAVATASSVLEVNPFDQPDVERAKELARSAMDGRGPPEPGSQPYGVRLDGAVSPELGRWLAKAHPGDYVAVQAFLAPTDAASLALERVAAALRGRAGTVVTVGYGPRFLHSTGQLHKGGPPSGLFLQLVDEPGGDLSVPGFERSFGEIVRAQAKGDRDALEERGRRLLVVNLGSEPLPGLRQLERLLRQPGSRPREARDGRRTPGPAGSGRPRRPSDGR